MTAVFQELDLCCNARNFSGLAFYLKDEKFKRVSNAALFVIIRRFLKRWIQKERRKESTMFGRVNVETVHKR